MNAHHDPQQPSSSTTTQTSCTILGANPSKLTHTFIYVCSFWYPPKWVPFNGPTASTPTKSHRSLQKCFERWSWLGSCAAKQTFRLPGGRFFSTVAAFGVFLIPYRNPIIHQKLNGTESQRTPLRKLLYRAIRYSGYFRGPFFRGSDVLEITFSSEWLVMEPQYQKRFVSVIFVHPQTINHPLKYGEVFGSLGLFVEAARPKTTLGRGLDS